MDFDNNLKAFLRRFPLKAMSGHQKFVAVAAFQAKGNLTQAIGIKDVQKQWRKSLLGILYNPAHYDRAQRAGWANPTAKGQFCVTQAGLDNLDALVPDITSGEMKKAGSLIIVNKKGTHTFDKFLRTTFAAAKDQVLIADSWVDETIFDNALDVIPKTANVKLMYSHNVNKFDQRSKRFAQQYPKFSSKRFKALHDRFIIVDDKGFIIGPSIKDAASNSPALVVLLGSKEKNLLHTFFNELWNKAK